MVLDNWLTLVICDRLVMMWLYCSFVVSVIIVRVIVFFSGWDVLIFDIFDWVVLNPMFFSNCRLLYGMRIPLTSILLLIDVSMVHHRYIGLYFM